MFLPQCIPAELITKNGNKNRESCASMDHMLPHKYSHPGEK